MFTPSIKQQPQQDVLPVILWYSTTTPSLTCDNVGLWEAAGCHLQKAKSETMRGLCASVWAQCEGATEVSGATAHSVFTQAGRDRIPPEVLHLQEREGEEEWLVKCRAASCIDTYRGRWTVNKRKEWRVKGLFKHRTINKLWIEVKIQRYVHDEEGRIQTCNTVMCH